MKRDVGRWAVRVVLGTAVLILLTAGLGPLTGAYRLATVLSGSMAPGMPAGSLAVLAPIDPGAVRVGDVITFEAPIPGRPIVTHRVVEIVEGGSHPVVTTKGDANATADPWVARVTGSPAWRRVAVIPHAGTAIRFFRSAPVHHATVQVVPLLLLGAALAAIWSPRKSGAEGPRPRFRPRLPTRPAVILASVFVMVAFPHGALATFTRTSSASHSVQSHPDWTPPSVDRSAIAKSTGYLANSVKQGGTYYVYANVTDTGNPPSGLSLAPAGVKANEGAVTAGQTNVALTAGSYSVNGQTYNYRSALQTADNPLAAGPKSYSVTPTDQAGNSAVQNGFSVTVDNTAPSAVDIQTSGDGDGNAEAGETVVFTFSEEIDPQSILSGWTGASTSVQVHVIDGNLLLFIGAPDTVRIFNSSGGSQLPFGDLTLPGAGYNVGLLGLPATTMVFSPSTMVKTAGSSVITITLGPRTQGSPDAGQSGAMSWDSTTTPYDAAGNLAVGDTQGESGLSDREF